MQIQPPTGNDLGFLAPYRADEEIFVLPSGSVAVPKYFLEFKEWSGTPIVDTYGNKVVLDFDGEPLFAELAVLRLFQKNYWQGAWVDSYRRKFRVGLPGIVEPIDLPQKQAELIRTLREKTGRFGGCWDVVVWKDSTMLFIELKRQKKDDIQDTQVEWLATALGSGLTAANFALAEWNLKKS